MSHGADDRGSPPKSDVAGDLVRPDLADPITTAPWSELGWRKRLSYIRECGAAETAPPAEERPAGQLLGEAVAAMLRLMRTPGAMPAEWSEEHKLALVGNLLRLGGSLAPDLMAEIVRQASADLGEDLSWSMAMAQGKLNREAE